MCVCVFVCVVFVCVVFVWCVMCVFLWCLCGVVCGVCVFSCCDANLFPASLFLILNQSLILINCA